MSAHQKNSTFGNFRTNSHRCLNAVQPRHQNIAEENIRSPAARNVNRFIAGADCDHAESARLESGRKSFKNNMIVIRDEDLRRYPIRQALLHDSTVDGQPPFLSVSSRHAGGLSRMSGTAKTQWLLPGRTAARARGQDGAEQVFGQRRALTPFPEAGDLPAAPALNYRSPSEKIAVT